MPDQVAAFEKFLINSKHKAQRYESTEAGFAEFLHIARSVAEAEQKPKKNKSNAPNTYVDLATPSRLNACAFSQDGVDCIALFKGSVEVITSLFNHILADPATFEGHGDISLETKPPLRGSLIPDTAWMDAEERRPADSLRRTIADRLRQSAYQFLSAHEVRHIRGGHVQYLKKHSSALFIEEIESLSHLSPDEIITHQTLEMNADAFAIGQGLTNLLAIVGKLDEGHVKPAFSQLLELWLYAVCAFFRLIAHERPFRLEEIALKVHPPARARLLWSLQTVQTWEHCGLLPLTSDEIFAIAGRVASRIEADIATITGTPVDLAGALTATDPEVDKRLEVLNTRYEQLRPELEELSYSTTPVYKWNN